MSPPTVHRHLAMAVIMFGSELMFVKHVQTEYKCTRKTHHGHVDEAGDDHSVAATWRSRVYRFV